MENNHNRNEEMTEIPFFLTQPAYEKQKKREAVLKILAVISVFLTGILLGNKGKK